jgi:hypothetical protein
MAVYDGRPTAFTPLTSTADWEAFMSLASTIGGAAIDYSVGSAMTPSLDTPGRNAVMADGNILIKGCLWRCDAPVSTPVPAASGQNRIDRLVIRLTRGASTAATVVQPAIVTGTPSGSPVTPALTQTPAGIWEFPISHWTSTSAGAIQTLIDDRRFTNDAWHDMRPLSNAFVGSISNWPPPQYRFSDDCLYVETAGSVQTPPTTGNYNGVTIATLPRAYRPISSNPQRIAIPGNIANQGANSSTPYLELDSNGVLSIGASNTSLNQSVFSINGRFLLEDTNGFLQT